MNEVLDKLLIRFLFTVFICLALVLYKYAHVLIYPSKKKQVLNKFYPSENYVDTLHMFSRLIGIALIFSSLEFNEYLGIFKSSVDFFLLGISGIILYLLAIFIIESIILYNFQYKDECLKKKNLAYGMVSFTNSICLAFMIRSLFQESEHSLIILFIMWLLSLVLYGFATKLYKYSSKLSFNSLMIQQNTGLGASYSGFLFGVTIIIISSFNHEHHDIISYSFQILLKTILALLIFPVFKYGISYIFKLQEPEELTQSGKYPLLGHGVYEGAIFLTCALLTSIIVGQIHFGTIYPFF